jgi:hypothetical protein
MQELQINDKDILEKRQETLAEAARILKTELVGIDDVIDRVIDSVRAWYVIPELINRPVVVCLWGLTGTGKTQLTRRLAQLLGFYDKFIELTMDTTSTVGGYRTSAISGVLAESSIEEKTPGILVLDEFQRFRTIDARGEDIKAERYQDVWTLLSDGKLSPSGDGLVGIERRMAEYHYDADRGEEEDDEDGAKKDKKFRLDPWDALELKRLLKLKAPLMTIMKWPPEKIYDMYSEYRDTHDSWETNHSKLLVFICGNLDEMYQETAQRVEDCDTDADVFNRITRKLSIIDVKKALSNRFKPEQIARLGNEHVIYPSFNKSTYEKLIANVCAKYCQDIKDQCGIEFQLSNELLVELYANSVFPSQGTRPLFSSIHSILSSNLVKASLWAIQQNVKVDKVLPVTISEDRKYLEVSGTTNDGKVTKERFPVILEINKIRHRSNSDFRALLAAHEAGHGIIYGLLFKQAPQEIKINIASFEGGYNSFNGLKIVSKQNILDMVCTSLGGRVAEEMIFGSNMTTTGSEGDYQQATKDAAEYIRHHGFGAQLSRTDRPSDVGSGVNTNVEVSNEQIEKILQDEYSRAKELLTEHSAIFREMIALLLKNGMATPVETQALFASHGVAINILDDSDDQELIIGDYAGKLAEFLGDSEVVTLPGSNLSQWVDELAKASR